MPRTKGSSIFLPVNRLAGVLGVASVWGVNPTNLAFCTDGNWLNMTGLGSKVVAAGTEAGRIVFDMGAVYNVHLRMKIQIGNNIVAGDNAYLKCNCSEDNITYVPAETSGNNLLTTWMPNTTKTIFVNAFVRGRYIQLIWLASTASGGTIFGAVWEIEAIDLGI